MHSSESTSAAGQPVEAESPEGYFTTGAVKLSLMTLATLGIYQLYWFYRNWRVIRDRDRSQIAPFWRAFFAPLWTFSMGSRFTEEAKDRNISLTLPVIPLGIVYLALSVLWRLPDPYWLVSFLTFVPLLPFDFAARRLNGGGELAAPTFGGFSRWNIAGLVIGAVFWVLLIVGLSLPEDAASQ